MIHFFFLLSSSVYAEKIQCPEMLFEIGKEYLPPNLNQIAGVMTGLRAGSEIMGPRQIYLLAVTNGTWVTDGRYWYDSQILKALETDEGKQELGIQFELALNELGMTEAERGEARAAFQKAVDDSSIAEISWNFPVNGGEINAHGKFQNQSPLIYDWGFVPTRGLPGSRDELGAELQDIPLSISVVRLPFVTDSDVTQSFLAADKNRDPVVIASDQQGYLYVYHPKKKFRTRVKASPSSKDKDFRLVYQLREDRGVLWLLAEGKSVLEQNSDEIVTKLMLLKVNTNSGSVRSLGSYTNAEEPTNRQISDWSISTSQFGEPALFDWGPDRVVALINDGRYGIVINRQTGELEQVSFGSSKSSSAKSKLFPVLKGIESVDGLQRGEIHQMNNSSGKSLEVVLVAGFARTHTFKLELKESSEGIHAVILMPASPSGPWRGVESWVPLSSSRD